MIRHFSRSFVRAAYLGLMTPTTINKTNTGMEAVLPNSASGDQQPSAKPSEAPAVVSNEKVAVTCFQPMRKPETFLSTDVKMPAKIESMGSSVSTLAARYSYFMTLIMRRNQSPLRCCCFGCTYQCRILTSGLFSFHHGAFFCNQCNGLQQEEMRLMSSGRS